MNDVTIWQLLLGLGVGISLAAASGFRVFTPLLVVSVAVHFFGVTVNSDFNWVGSWLALIILGTATIVEMLSYYIPWVDTALDVINTPLALVAGAVVMSGMMPDIHPGLRWAIALIVGTGAAGITQVATTVVRSASSATTGGLGNNVVSSSENVCATGLSIMAFIFPIVAALLGVTVLIVIAVIARKMIRKVRINSR